MSRSARPFKEWGGGDGIHPSTFSSAGGEGPLSRGGGSLSKDPSTSSSAGGIPQPVPHQGVSLNLSLSRGYPSTCTPAGGIPQPVPQQGVWSLNLSTQYFIHMESYGIVNCANFLKPLQPLLKCNWHNFLETIIDLSDTFWLSSLLLRITVFIFKNRDIKANKCISFCSPPPPSLACTYGRSNLQDVKL